MPPDATELSAPSLGATQSEDGGVVPGLVSVALPVYNGERELAQAIDSVLAQTYKPVELIVVNDGSTDGTQAVLQSYGARIRTVRQTNGGLVSARNTGIAQARGEFIALMDHDDVCAPERLAVQVAFLKAHPDVGLCCSDFGAFDASGSLARSYISTYYSMCATELGGPLALYPEVGELDISDLLPERSGSPEIVKVASGPVYDAMARGNFAHPPTVMVRASVLRQVGGFDPLARAAADWDWLVRVARITQLGYIDRPLLAYRRSQNQMSSHKARDSYDGFTVYRMSIARDPGLLERNPVSMRTALGEAALDAAYSNAETRPWLALRLLAEASFRFRVVGGFTLRTLIKVLVPNGLLRRLRGSRAAAS